MITNLSKILPINAKKVIKRMLPRHHRAATTSNLWNTTSFHDSANPGPIITGVFSIIKTIPGWFNIDDCSHFFLIMSLQSRLGIKGDLFEIGSYHGRSTALMCYCLKDDEKVVVCDAFESDTDDPYTNRPSPESLISNIRRVNPKLDVSRIEIHQCLSAQLSIDREAKFRFVHIDGGHSKEAALSDLLLCRDHILPGGVIAIDDYMHKDWPGVTAAVKEFMSEPHEFEILADLNRHGAIGRKLYLIRTIR